MMRIRLAAPLLLGPLLLAISACAVAPTPSPSPNYLVFFTERSATLEQPAREVVGRAATAAQATPGVRVFVLGWTDSGGSPQADVTLSQQRARTVADALIADGVAPDRITRQGRGQTHDDPGVESRRVEIRIGG